VNTALDVQYAWTRRLSLLSAGCARDPGNRERRGQRRPCMTELEAT
jgi:hypothetical protein